MVRGTHDNDDEKLTFISLAALTANVVRYLQKENSVDHTGNADEKRSDKEKAEPDKTYVEQRLRDLAAFERRAGRKD